jgi:hypothetical protein
MRVDVPRAVVLYLLWLGFISGALIVGMSDLSPLPLGVIDPTNVFTLLIEAELFFVLVIWPFFVPRLLKPKVELSAARLGAEGHLLVLQVGVLFVVALPVGLLCQNLASVSPGGFLAGHLLVVVMASFVASLFAIAEERRVSVAPWYLLGMFACAGGFPFAHFLTGGRLGWLASASPFWAAAGLGTGAAAPMVLSAVFGGLTVALFGVGPFLRRASDPR